MQYRQTGTIISGFNDALRGLASDQRDQIYAVGDSVVKVFDAAGEQQGNGSGVGPIEAADEDDVAVCAIRLES